jgi:hypothetical protein
MAVSFGIQAAQRPRPAATPAITSDEREGGGQHDAPATKSFCRTIRRLHRSELSRAGSTTV